MTTITTPTDRWEGHGSLLELVRHRLDELVDLRCFMVLSETEQAEYEGLVELEERLLRRM
ncbi:MAG: hypothetical protein JWO37_153 [Acidimicrobiales bacterium]|jgi:hypothetical protein|nr:hypothetical protein [Acidimicrobiales bacterium]